MHEEPRTKNDERARRAIIISDLHLGSPYVDAQQVLDFLDDLPHDGPLILNGDVINCRHSFSHIDHRIFERLRDLSQARQVIWIRGNHDPRWKPDDPGRIEFKHEHILHDDICIAHGHTFDPPRLLRRWLSLLLGGLYSLYRLTGGTPIHSATFVKRFRRLYRVYINRVTERAAQFATQHGHATMILGHTHCAEDTTRSGVRVINAGAWTNGAHFYLSVQGNTIDLHAVTNPGGPTTSAAAHP